MFKKLLNLKRRVFLLLACLLLSIGASAQGIITGKVTGSDDQLPIVGATIKFKGRTGGAITDANGAFSLRANPTDVLIVSFLGYRPQEVTVGTQTSLAIVLQPDVSNLNEVVVVGYGTQTKKDLTTAVVSISSKDLENQPVTNPMQAIQGKAAGVQVNSQSGKPGSGVSITIRGNTSINASNSPLYVIDGVTSRDASFINPADIESMTILKDASGAAIYGSSGANGVVLITTKKGNQKLSIGFNAFTGFSNLWQDQKVLNREQYVALMGDMGYDVAGLGNQNTNW